MCTGVQARTEQATAAASPLTAAAAAVVVCCALQFSRRLAVPAAQAACNTPSAYCYLVTSWAQQWQSAAAGPARMACCHLWLPILPSECTGFQACTTRRYATADKASTGKCKWVGAFCLGRAGVTSTSPHLEPEPNLKLQPCGTEHKVLVPAQRPGPLSARATTLPLRRSRRWRDGGAAPSHPATPVAHSPSRPPAWFTQEESEHSGSTGGVQRGRSPPRAAGTHGRALQPEEGN